jgi:hypothetical protein
MRDVELVLRFAAFYHNTYLNYKPPIKKFLNSDMEKYRSINNADAEELRSAFKNTLTIIKSLLDNHAFKRFYKGTKEKPNGNWEPKKFNTALYDVLMYTFARRQKNIIYQHLDMIREAFINLLSNDEEFIRVIEISTSSFDSVIKRFDKLRLAVDDIIGINKREPRCFSFKLKLELFNNDPTCRICQQHIQNIDDAAIDHIEQYWRGGKTIPENARLTHRYCNWARPKNE